MRFKGPTGRPGALDPAQLRSAPRLIVKSTAPEASVAFICHPRQPARSASPFRIISTAASRLNLDTKF